MKRLIIRNFGPIKTVDIELKRVNLIIGPQSSGKSTVLKVACFCDWMECQIEISQNPQKYCTPSSFKSNLVEFHRMHGYLQPHTYIKYENDAMIFEYSAEDQNCTFEWKDTERWGYRRAKIAYIPSERNLVAAIPNWYQISMNKDNILDFMKEWEFARKCFSDGEQILDMPVKYQYNRNTQDDRIKLDSGEELVLTMASSGLQSMTPLYIMLRYLTSEYYKITHTNVEETIFKENLTRIVASEFPTLDYDKQLNIVNSILTPYHTDLFIEEPEAHIFPSTQKSFVYSLASMLCGERKHSCFIATHSPYIMTSFNNVILAGEKNPSLKGIDPECDGLLKNQSLRFDEVAAFEIKDGNARSIMDNEYQLISADAIDAASQEIAKDFDYLMNL